MIPHFQGLLEAQRQKAADGAAVPAADGGVLPRGYHGQPQEDETASTVTPRTDQPLLPAGQDVVTITSADDLPLLLRMFPAPALTPTTSGWPLVVGTCYDVAFENGMGRILTLTYQASDTIQVTLTSIYPARAIALLEKGDYRISASLGATLAGLRSSVWKMRRASDCTRRARKHFTS